MNFIYNELFKIYITEHSVRPSHSTDFNAVEHFMYTIRRYVVASAGDCQGQGFVTLIVS